MMRVVGGCDIPLEIPEKGTPVFCSSKCASEHKQQVRRILEVLEKRYPGDRCRQDSLLRALVRRSQIKLIRGGEKDEPAPAALESEFNL